MNIDKDFPWDTIVTNREYHTVFDEKPHRLPIGFSLKKSVKNKSKMKAHYELGLYFTQVPYILNAKAKVFQYSDIPILNYQKKHLRHIKKIFARLKSSILTNNNKEFEKYAAYSLHFNKDVLSNESVYQSMHNIATIIDCNSKDIVRRRMTSICDICCDKLARFNRCRCEGFICYECMYKISANTEYTCPFCKGTFESN